MSKRPISSRRKELDQDPIVMVRLLDIMPSPENEELYRPILDDDPEIIALARSILKEGLLQPIVITADNFIVSGHRRHKAAQLAGLSEVPCRRMNIRREGYPEFHRLLREHNRQREKTRDELLREEIVSVDPEEAHRALSEYRRQKAKIRIDPIEIRQRTQRATISKAKKFLLDACRAVIEKLSDYWPLADRQIHYQLLNKPPLIHASKPDSRYRNNKASYKALVELLTRARHAGLVPYNVIADATRPVTEWTVYDSVGSYYETQIADILNGYFRDLMQSQPNHIEIVAEKLTVESIVKPIGGKYCIPVTIGRGFCSTRPLYDISQRYRSSGKRNLIVLSISDLDPDGDEITHSIARRLRDDFKISRTKVIKVALTSEQVEELALPPNSERAKRTSTNFPRFIERYGSDLVYELEAVPPATLAELLTRAVDSVLDIDAFNAEIDAERQDAAHIATSRHRVLSVLKGVTGSE